MQYVDDSDDEGSGLSDGGPAPSLPKTSRRKSPHGEPTEERVLQIVAFIHTCAHVYMDTIQKHHKNIPNKIPIHTNTHACTHMHARTHTHACTDAHTRTHTHTVVMAEKWLRQETEAIKKHLKVITIYMYSPFLYGHAHQSDKACDWSACWSHDYIT